MNNLQPKLLLLLYLSCISSTASATDNLFNLGITDLMQIQVYSANKSNQTINDLSASVTILTRTDIEKFGYTTIDDLIRHLPGLFLIDTYRNQVIGTRGSIGGSFAFLINGVLLHPASTPALRSDLRGRMNIAIESIDRIEFVRGPQSVTYGDSAFYGSINVITNDADNSSRVALGVGDNQQRQAFGRYSSKFEEGSIVINAGLWQTDGIGGDLTTTLSNQQLASLFTGSKLELDGLLAHDNKNLEISGNYLGWTGFARYSDISYGFYANTPSFDVGNTRDVTDQLINLGYKGKIGQNWAYKIDLSANQQDLEIDSFDFVLPFLDGFQRQSYQQYNLDMHTVYSGFDSTELLLGIWHQRTSTEHTNQTSLMGDIVQHQRIKANGYNDTDIYAQANVFIVDTLQVNAGVRLSRADDFSATINDLLNNDISREQRDSEVTVLPQFGAIYHYRTNTSFKAQYGQGNQRTEFPERRNDDELIENLDLQYLHSTQSSSISTTLFYNTVKNLERSTLRLVPDPQNPGESLSEVRTDNSGGLKSHGLELIYNHQVTPQFGYNLSFSYQATTDSNNPNIEPGYSPNWLGKFDITHQLNSLTLNLAANFVDDMRPDWQLNSSGEVVRIGEDVSSYIELNTNIRYELTPQLYCNFKVSNLLDKDIRYPATEFVNFASGGFGYGRQFLLTVNYTFR